MQVRLTDRHTGNQTIVAFSYAQIQIERMYAAPTAILERLRLGTPLVTHNWVYELVQEDSCSGQ